MASSVLDTAISGESLLSDPWILTDAETSRRIRLVDASITLFVSKKLLVLLDTFGATRRIRTDDLLITNQLLYHLS
jgi:hypothetical protein